MGEQVKVLEENIKQLNTRRNMTDIYFAWYVREEICVEDHRYVIALLMMLRFSLVNH